MALKEICFFVGCEDRTKPFCPKKGTGEGEFELDVDPERWMLDWRRAEGGGVDEGVRTKEPVGDPTVDTCKGECWALLLLYEAVAIRGC